MEPGFSLESYPLSSQSHNVFLYLQGEEGRNERGNKVTERRDEKREGGWKGKKEGGKEKENISRYFGSLSELLVKD